MLNQAPDVQDQPRVVVEIWRTYVIGNEIYLVCVMPGTTKVRVTTPVQATDPDKQEFITKSGRVYQCVGPMAPNLPLLRVTLLLNGLIDDIDSIATGPDLLQ
jgi:hypothetical protein